MESGTTAESYLIYFADVLNKTIGNISNNKIFLILYYLFIILLLLSFIKSIAIQIYLIILILRCWGCWGCSTLAGGSGFAR